MGINVLSLFDGMSCGQIALERAGIKVDNYFASEIKPHAIRVTQHNYPNTIQLGDVTKLTGDGLPRIDLLIGGSPCQDFSRGNKERTGLDGEKSGLFMEYLRIKKEINPKYFLLENVVMDYLDRKKIDDFMNCLPIRINSELVSAQLRDRMYWTNIGPYDNTLFGLHECLIPTPTDKGIKLSDVLEDGYCDMDKSRALLESDSRPLATPLKMFHRYFSTGFTTCVFKSKEAFEAMKGAYIGNVGEGDPEIFSKDKIRYLNQRELERLQTVPLGYTEILNRNDAACLLGDGWTVDVIAHIFSYLPKEWRKG